MTPEIKTRVAKLDELLSTIKAQDKKARSELEETEKTLQMMDLRFCAMVSTKDETPNYTLVFAPPGDEPTPSVLYIREESGSRSDRILIPKMSSEQLTTALRLAPTLIDRLTEFHKQLLEG